MILLIAVALSLAPPARAAAFDVQTLDAIPTAPMTPGSGYSAQQPLIPSDAAALPISAAPASIIAAPMLQAPAALAVAAKVRARAPVPTRSIDVSFDGGQASLLPALEEPPLKSIAASVHRRARHFVAPNETRPGDALPILSQAPRGAYVAVGTERGFMGAAAAAKATHLILADRDPEVVLYNRINRALMQAAGSDRQKYLGLRLAENHGAWLQALSSARIPKESAALLSDEKVWSAWAKHQDGAAMRAFNARPKRPSDAFYGLNYLHDDALYAKLSGMAVQGRIAAVQLDFKNEQGKLAKLVDALRQKGVALSVLDLSNARQERYVGKEKTLATIRAFGQAEKDAVVLLTQYWSDKKAVSHRTRWGYYGFRSSDLTPPDDDALLDALGKSRKLLKVNSLNSLSSDPPDLAVEKRLAGFRVANGRSIRNGVQFRQAKVATPDVLTLRIKRFFFDKILSGEKKFEYRERSPQNDALIEAARKRGAKFLRLHFQDNDVQLLAAIDKIDVVSGKEASEPWDAAQGIEPSNKPHWRIAVRSPRLIWDNPKSRAALNDSGLAGQDSPALDYGSLLKPNDPAPTDRVLETRIRTIVAHQNKLRREQGLPETGTSSFRGFVRNSSDPRIAETDLTERDHGERSTVIKNIGSTAIVSGWDRDESRKGEINRGSLSYVYLFDGSQLTRAVPLPRYFLESFREPNVMIHRTMSGEERALWEREDLSGLQVRKKDYLPENRVLWFELGASSPKFDHGGSDEGLWSVPKETLLRWADEGLLRMNFMDGLRDPEATRFVMEVVVQDKAWPVLAGLKPVLRRRAVRR